MVRPLSCLSLIVVLAAGVVLSSCRGARCHIVGTLTDGDGQMLYLERVALDGPTVIDSFSLSKSAHFAFSPAAGDGPEFYRLRVDKQVINLSVDSTETITIAAAVPTMSREYTVEGSANCAKIKELTLLQQALQRRVTGIIRDPSLPLRAVGDSIDSVIAEYKTLVKNDYIYAAPAATYAYYALFQTITIGTRESLLFSPRSDGDDIKAFAAVGTCWDTYHPGTVRGAHLHNIVIESMKNSRIVAAQQSQTISADKIDTSGIVEITLADNQGTVRRLSDLRGNVVLLDFCSFAQEGTTQRIMALRDLYNKYHSRGFDIFQVSVDENTHFWKTQTAALPWTSVNDTNGQYLVVYNVQQIPTFFLLQRDCTPYARDVQISDIDATIEELLR